MISIYLRPKHRRAIHFIFGVSVIVIFIMTGQAVSDSDVQIPVLSNARGVEIESTALFYTESELGLSASRRLKQKMAVKHELERFRFQVSQ